MSWPLYVALAVELLALIAVIATWVIERNALASFCGELLRQVESRDNVGPRKDPAHHLRGSLREAGTTLERALKAGREVDESLAEAVTTVATAPLRASLVWSIVFDALLVLVALLPLIFALEKAAIDVASIWNATRGVDWPRAYLKSLDGIPAAFSSVRSGFASSALLIVGLFVIWVLRWLLLRPEMREARAVKAFLSCVTRVQKDVVAPLSIKVVQILARPRTIWPGLWSSLAFMAASASAVVVLNAAADLRRQNTVPLTFASWPDFNVRADRLSLPAYFAGSKLGRGPSLIITQESAQIGSTKMTALEAGKLPAGWDLGAQLGDSLDNFATTTSGWRVHVLAHRELSFEVPLGVMKFLRDRGAPRFQLVVQRRIPFAGERGVQAGLQLELVPSGTNTNAAAVMRVFDDRVVVRGSSGPERSISFGAPRWAETLRGAVRDHLAAASPAGSPMNLRVEVRLERAPTYDRFVAALAVPDSVCSGEADCGLPGLGLQYFLPL